MAIENNYQTIEYVLNILLQKKYVVWKVYDVNSSLIDYNDDLDLHHEESLRLLKECYDNCAGKYICIKANKKKGQDAANTALSFYVMCKNNPDQNHAANIFGGGMGGGNMNMFMELMKQNNALQMQLMQQNFDHKLELMQSKNKDDKGERSKTLDLLVQKMLGSDSAPISGTGEPEKKKVVTARTEVISGTGGTAASHTPTPEESSENKEKLKLSLKRLSNHTTLVDGLDLLANYADKNPEMFAAMLQTLKNEQ